GDTQADQQQRPEQPAHTAEVRARQARAQRLAHHRPAGATRHPATRGRATETGLAVAQGDAHQRRASRLSARMESTSCWKSRPTARAAMGTRLWSVMPGTVFTSSSQKAPA